MVRNLTLYHVTTIVFHLLSEDRVDSSQLYCRNFSDASPLICYYYVIWHGMNSKMVTWSSRPIDDSGMGLALACLGWSTGASPSHPGIHRHACPWCKVKGWQQCTCTPLSVIALCYKECCHLQTESRELWIPVNLPEKGLGGNVAGLSAFGRHVNAYANINIDEWGAELARLAARSINWLLGRQPMEWFCWDLELTTNRIRQFSTVWKPELDFWYELNKGRMYVKWLTVLTKHLNLCRESWF